MKIVFAWIVFFSITLTAKAQHWPFELWHTGKIVLESGDTLKGIVKYNLQQDLLQYSPDEKTTEAYTPRKVLFFEIYDKSVHKYRQFFSMPFNTNAGYNAPIFFELLEEGKMTLLSREAIEYRTYSSPYYMGGYSRQVLVNKFFFIDEKGNINPFTGNRKDLLDMMGRKAEDVEKYMKANRLNYEDKYEFAKIIEYYNSL